MNKYPRLVEIKKGIDMSTDTITVVVFVIAVIGLFALARAWADYQSTTYLRGKQPRRESR
jgi:hypothetical protein